MKKPYLMLPQLIILILQIGVLIALVLGLLVINILGDELKISYTLIILFFLLSGL